MTYTTPSTRIAYFRGIRLGTELITIIPSVSRLGGNDGTDIDQDIAFVSVNSPSMKFSYSVLSYLHGSNTGASTPQLELQKAFMQEMRSFIDAGLKFNDLVWVDDVSKTTLVNKPGADIVGEQTSVALNVDNLTALSISNGDYVWIGSETANEGFFAKVLANGAGSITIDKIPGEVLLGGFVEEEARRVGDNYTVYKAFSCYRRCKYRGQALPEVQENSQDDHRFNMTYQFDSDNMPIFTGAV